MLVLLLVAAYAHQTAKPVDWQAMIPSVRSVLKNDPESREMEQHYSIAIRRTADITGGRCSGGAGVSKHWRGIHGRNHGNADREWCARGCSFQKPRRQDSRIPAATFRTITENLSESHDWDHAMQAVAHTGQSEEHWASHTLMTIRRGGIRGCSPP